MYSPEFLLPCPCLPAGQGSQSELLVAPALGPKVPFGHGCCALKLVPGRQKYPAGHSSGVRAPEPTTQRRASFSRKYYKTWQAMSFSINIFSLPPPILVQPDPGHGIHHVYADAVVQIPVVVIGEKQHLQRNCASSAIHLTLRQTSKIRRMNCTPDVPLSFHWLQREDKNLAQI